MTARLLAPLALIVIIGCPRTASDEANRSVDMDTTRIGPRLRHVVDESPDSVIAVLVRTRAEEADSAEAVEIDDETREALEDAGLRIGTVAGSIVTGRIVARDVERLARVHSVVYIELSARIPVPRPPANVTDDTSGVP